MKMGILGGKLSLKRLNERYEAQILDTYQIVVEG